jgi:hypothetical protein
MHQATTKRRSTALSRKQMQVLRQSLAEAPDDPQMRAARGHLMLLMADALGLSLELTNPDDERGVAALRKALGSEASNVFYALNLTTSLLGERAPEASFILRDYLPDFIHAVVCYQLTQLTGEVLPRTPYKTHHLLPNNPLWIDANGAVQGWELVPMKDWERVFRELRDYRRSLEPARPRGRPRKTDPAPPTKPSRRIDPSLARQAYDLFREGGDWKMIARELLHIPEVLLKHPKKREALRSRITRLIERGEALAMESA